MYYPGNDLDKPVGNLIIDLRRVTDLGSEPVTLAEAKTQLRVTFADDDTEITKLITKARRYVENYCNISIVYQRIQLTATICEAWQLPYGPVIGIESVLDSNSYSGSGPVTFTNSDIKWEWSGDTFYSPSNYTHRVQYTAGMGTVPEDLKDAILQVLTFLYENRGKTIDVTGLQEVLKNAQNYQRLLWI
jgi:hypothetical protein